MADLNDLFKVLSEGKKASIESNPGKKRLQELSKTLKSELISPTPPAPSNKPILEESVEIQEVKTPKVQQIHKQEEIEKALKVNATFQQPNPDPVALDPKAVQSKLKFLEQAIGKIAATGPGSGEVLFHRLDDVSITSVQNDDVMLYDASSKKWTNRVLSFPEPPVINTFGNVEEGNYSEFEADGTLVAKGSATCFRDELHDLIKSAANNPGSRLVYDFDDGSLVFKTNATIVDYALMNIQINHDWKLGTNIEPHIHWKQEQNNTPNWLIQYRWQANGEQKTLAWTPVKYDHNAFDYAGGILNQITSFGPIVPPETASLSDIIQFRIIRDTTNTSGLFGADPYTIDAASYSFDIHIEIDTLGSRQTYVK